jgi:predicted Zn-ribbon and HTH transcriptional regulator
MTIPSEHLPQSIPQGRLNRAAKGLKISALRCQACGELMDRFKIKSRWCSAKCQQAISALMAAEFDAGQVPTIPTECKRCGGTFQRIKKHSGRPQQYCGALCQRRANSAAQRRNRHAAATGQGLLYAISDGTAVKLGFTKKSAESRLIQLQKGCPRELFVVWTKAGDAQEEACLHQRFADLRIRGEWFSISVLDNLP